MAKPTNRKPLEITVTPPHMKGHPIDVAAIALERIGALLSALMLVHDANAEPTNEFSTHDAWMLVVLVDDHVRVVREALRHLTTEEA